MHAHVRGVNFNIRLCSPINAKIHQARGQLDLNFALSQVRHLSFRVLVEPHHVGRIELGFCPRPIPRRQFVTRHHGSIHRACHPITSITVHD
jgi:hypothetical protein